MNNSVIFLVEEDDDTRLILRENLKKNGYNVSLAIDEEDALDRINNGCLKADLILMNLLRKTPEKILEIGRTILLTGKLNVPIVVIAAKYGEDLEGQNVQVNENEYITYLENGEQLFSLLSRLLPVIVLWAVFF
jgi:DNA-binding response OmpR family regulator